MTARAARVGRAAARERDGVLLPRVRLRLRLPPLARQRRRLAVEGRRRRRSRSGPSSRCSSSRARGAVWLAARRRAAAAARSSAPASRSGSPRSSSRSSCGRPSGSGRHDGGYASVFFGWTAFYFLFLLLTLVRLEIELATAIRNPRGDKASARRALVLRLVPRGDRRAHLDRPLPRSGRDPRRTLPRRIAADAARARRAARRGDRVVGRLPAPSRASSPVSSTRECSPRRSPARASNVSGG